MHGSVSVMYTQSRNFIIKQFTKYKSYCIKLVCTFNYYKFGNISSGSKIGCFTRDNLTYKRFRADLNSRREAYILRYNNIDLPKQRGKNPVYLRFFDESFASIYRFVSLYQNSTGRETC